MEARRTQILMGAAQVFAEKGYHKATTRKIAKAAGISEGTIYNYFNNKRELLVAMIELIATQSLKTIASEHAADDPKTFLTVILQDRYRLLQERGHILAPIMAEIFSDESLRKEVYQQILMPLTRLVEQYMQSHIDSGKFRPINPLIATRAIIGAVGINSTLKLTALDPRYDDISTDSMIEQLVSLFVDGLATDGN